MSNGINKQLIQTGGGGGGGGAVDSVNGQTGVVVLDTGDIAEVTDRNYVSDAELVVIGNTSGTNTGDQNIFRTIAVSGQSNVVADSPTDTLTLVAGSNIVLTTNAATDTVTISASGGGSANADYEEIVSSGQTVFTLSAFTYTPGDNGLVVYVNGLKQSIGTHYTETSSTSVTFTSTVTSGNVVDFHYQTGVGDMGPAGSNGPYSGTTTIDFGNTPGTNIITKTITGQTDIATGAKVKAYINGGSTASHNEYEHAIAPIKLTCGNVVAGTGFTIYAVSDWRLTGTFNIAWEYIL